MHMHAYACTCMHMHAYACICMHIHACARMCMHIYAYARTMCMHMRAHACTCMHTDGFVKYLEAKYFMVYACMCMYVHACACMCMYVHTYACTYMHIKFIYIFFFWGGGIPFLSLQSCVHILEINFKELSVQNRTLRCTTHVG